MTHFKYILIIWFLFIFAGAKSQGIDPTSIQGSTYENGFLRATYKVWDENLADSIWLYQHVDTTYFDGFITNPDSIYRTGNTIYLRDGDGTVSLVPYLDNTDNQNLSIDSLDRVFTITIAGGNSIKFKDTDGVDSIYLQGDSLIVLRDGDGFAYKTRVYTDIEYPSYSDVPNPQVHDIWSTVGGDLRVWNGSYWNVMSDDTQVGNEGDLSISTTGNYIILNSNTLAEDMEIRGGRGIIMTDLFLDRVKIDIDSVYVMDLIHDSLQTIISGIDSTIVDDGWGINVAESPVNTWTVSADSLEVATPYDLTLKQDLITGTTSQTTRFSGTNTLVATSSLWNDGTSIGIGTTSPAGKLHLSASTNTALWFTDTGEGTNEKQWFMGTGTGLLNNGFVLGTKLDNNSNGANAFEILRNATSTAINSFYFPWLTGSVTDMMTITAAGAIGRQTIPTGTVTSVGLTTGTSGTDVNISGSPITTSGTITLNLPSASASNRGLLTAANWTTFNSKLGSLNGLTNATQTFATSTASTGFTISSSGSTHTFNLPYDENSVGLRLGLGSAFPSNGISIGTGAGHVNGTNNTAIGKDVLRSAGSTGSGGTNNFGIAFQTLYSLTTGINNGAIGNYAMFQCTSCYDNVEIGEQSLNSLVSGAGNVAVGRWAGKSALGSNNIFLGALAGYLETGSNGIFIGELVKANQSTNRFGINTAFASLSATLHVTGSQRLTGGFYDSNNDLGSSGQVLSTTGAATDWITPTAGTVTGTGAANYMTYWTSSTNIDDTNIKYDSDGLGFNVADPLFALHLDAKSIYLDNGSTIVDDASSGGAANNIFAKSASNTVAWRSSSNLGLVTGTGTATRVAFWDSGTSISSDANMYWDNTNDRLGINTTTPSQSLDVNANVRFRDRTYSSTATSGASGQYIQSTGSGTAWTWSYPAYSLSDDDSDSQLFEIQSGSLFNIVAGTNGTSNLTGGATAPTYTINNEVEYGELYNTGNLTGLTFDATFRTITFSQVYENIVDADASTERITVPSTGTYEISYSMTFQYPIDGGGQYTQSQYTELYKNGSSLGYHGQVRSRNADNTVANLTAISRNIIVDLTASDYIELKYQNTGGTSGATINIYNANLSVKRVK